MHGVLRDRLMLRYVCRWCGHEVHFDPKDVAQGVTHDLAFVELAARFKCSRCGIWGGTVFVTEDTKPRGD